MKWRTNMKVYIYDYNNNRKEVEITKEVVSAVLLVVSGDQILKVKYEDGMEDTFDSCESFRSTDFFDECYFVELEDGKDFQNAK